MAYGKITGSSIGSLLRMIAEQKSESPIVPPSAEVGSPVRKVVQEPLEAPESPGATRLVNIKPEGITAPEGPDVLSPTRTSFGPISIGGPGEPFGAGGARTLSDRQTELAAKMPPPSQGEPAQGQPSAARVSPPSLGTQITPVIPKQTVRYSAGAGGQQEAPNLDKLYADIAASTAATNELLAKGDVLGAQTGGESIKTLNDLKAEKAALEFARNPESTQAQQNFRENIQSASWNPQPSPTPTPAPASPSAFRPQVQMPQVSRAPQANIQRAVASGGLSVPQRAPAYQAPSVPQKIATTITSLLRRIGW